MKELEFINLSNRWFINIPYEGDINDLQMVDGADELLDEIAEGRRIIRIVVTTSDSISKPDYILEKIKEDNMGGTYTIIGDVKQLWLCNVTKLIFENFPNKIYIYK
jgi:hypothetical protein